MMNSPKALRDKVKKSLFDEPEDGPFCEEQESPPLPPELRDTVMTSIPEVVPAEPEQPEPQQPEPQPERTARPLSRRDCGCPPIPPPEPPTPPLPGTLPPEAPLPPDSPYVYVENEYGELAAMWKRPQEHPLEDTVPVSAPQSAFEPQPASEAPPEELAPQPEPARQAPAAPQWEEAPAPPARPDPISPFQSVSLPEPPAELRPEPRYEPKSEPRYEPKPEPRPEPRPREVWRMG